MEAENLFCNMKIWTLSLQALRSFYNHGRKSSFRLQDCLALVRTGEGVCLHRMCRQSLIDSHTRRNIRCWLALVGRLYTLQARTLDKCSTYRSQFKCSDSRNVICDQVLGLEFKAGMDFKDFSTRRRSLWQWYFVALRILDSLRTKYTK